VLLAGEPCIGKTRTAEELAREARRRGARVLHGRCHEGEGAPSYWPWVQILREAVREAKPALLAAQMGRVASDIAQLVPELHDRLPDLPEPPALESDHARFRLFDGVASFLRNASCSHPLVLILDDLHRADRPTLLLLQFLTRELRSARVLLIGAYRDVEVRRQHPLALVLGELVREPHCHRVPLRGLSREEVGRFVTAASGAQAPEALVRAVYEMTEGNPFFVHETVRLLAAEGRLGDAPEAASWRVTLPEGVRDVIGRRLDTLSAECNRVLRLASVIGREFRVNVLEAIARLPDGRVLERLQEALDARILVDAPGAESPPPIGRYAFSHTLIRETLYEELSGPERVRLHRRVGEALEAVYGADVGAHLPELAHHFHQAAPGGDVERAVSYAERAARKAHELLASEEGVEHYRRALEVLEFAVPVDEARRCELTLALGWARTFGGERLGGAATFERAAEIARRIKRPDLLGAAAIGAGGWPLSAGRGPVEPNLGFRALVEEALREIGDDDPGLRARLVAGLAVTPPDQDSMERRKALSEEALKLARQTRDADALFDALYARLWAFLDPDDAEERVQIATEFLARAAEIGAKEKIFTGYENRARTLLMLGDVPGADRDIEACALLAEDLRLPLYHYSVARFQASRALGDGRFDEAEQLIGKEAELGRRARDPGVETVTGIQRAWLHRERGSLAEIEPFFAHFVEELSWLRPLAEGLVAYLYGAMGRLAESRQHFEVCAAQGFARLPRDEHWLSHICLAAEACCDLADRSRASELYALLAPYGHLLMAHQTARLYGGSASHGLGRLAALLGRREEAIRHFEAALVANAGIGARPAEARTAYELARLLLNRTPGSDSAVAVTAREAQRAGSLLAEAGSSAQRLGMAGLLGSVRDLAGAAATERNS
jgi:tetratricopeptide (TPR) repeat protein